MHKEHTYEEKTFTLYLSESDEITLSVKLLDVRD